MKIVSFDVGVKNLAYCILDEETILKWNVVEIVYKTNEELCIRLVEVLDKYPELLTVNRVVIEKQPSKNNKMRIVEALLNSYFVIKGITVSTNPVEKVIVYSAKHKLGSNTMKGKSNYRERKKLSMTRCEKYIQTTNQNDEFIQQYNSSKKKDDLADSLLQGLSYLNINKFKEIEVQDLDTSCKIVMRKPNKKQEMKMYSKSNLKWIINEYHESKPNATYLEVATYVNELPKLKKAVYYWYQQAGLSKAFREFDFKYTFE